MAPSYSISPAYPVPGVIRFSEVLRTVLWFVLVPFTSKVSGKCVLQQASFVFRYSNLCHVIDNPGSLTIVPWNWLMDTISWIVYVLCLWRTLRRSSHGQQLLSIIVYLLLRVYSQGTNWQENKAVMLPYCCRSWVKLPGEHWWDFLKAQAIIFLEHTTKDA